MSSTHPTFPILINALSTSEEAGGSTTALTPISTATTTEVAVICQLPPSTTEFTGRTGRVMITHCIPSLWLLVIDRSYFLGALMKILSVLAVLLLFSQTKIKAL